MSEFTGETLYNLLPAIYRIRDAQQGEALRALLWIIETQVMSIEKDIDRLYNNWFIETCDEWVVPYIGDLVGVKTLHPVFKSALATASFSQRAYVGKTLYYRRRKGTRTALEQLAEDISGWPALAVEFFQLLGTTQNLNHQRPENVRTPNIRDASAMELINGPFDSAGHTIEVRHANDERGKYNIPSIGLYLWRLESFGAEEVVAVPDGPAGTVERFRVSPLGADMQLYNQRAISALPDVSNRESSLPGPLRRLAIYDDLETMRQSLAEGSSLTDVLASSLYFNTDPGPVFTLHVAGQPLIPAQEILICDLSTWKLPPATLNYTVPGGATVPLKISVSFDPVNGRVAFPAGVRPQQVRASYYYGFSGSIGGGFYDRSGSLASDANSVVYPVGETAAQTLGAQLTKWTNDKPNSAVIEIQDSLDYLPQTLAVPAGLALEIRGNNEQRPLIAPPDPTVPWTISLGDGASLTLDGLLIAASIVITSDGQPSLTIQDSTLVPGLALTTDGDPAHPMAKSLISTASSGPGSKPGELAVTIQRSITGAINLPADDGVITIADSIIDGLGGNALQGGTAIIDRTTVFGATTLLVLERGSDAIFTAPLDVERTQEGCARFSFVPDGSRVPRSFRCQPDLALTTYLADLAKVDPTRTTLTPAERQGVIDRVEPSFTSERYGDAGYAQLSASCAPEITGGADDESEMGAFQFLHQPQREANLRSSLDECLRFGLEAGLFFIS
jgi:hypothetical protein